MTIERLTQLVTGRFGGVGASRGSFVRIHVWALVFLVAIAAITPVQSSRIAYRHFFGPVNVVSRSADDQRAFYPSAYKKKGTFHIAWIMGSEGNVIPKNRPGVGYLASYVRKALPEIDGRPVVVDAYYLVSMKLGDDYLSLLDALATKPDMVVLSLNPLFVFDPRAVHQWDQLDARAAVQLADKPREWPIGAAVVSPSDLMWGFAQSFLRPIAERTYWSTRVHDVVDTLGPLDRSKLAAVTAAAKPDRADRILLEQPASFFRKPPRPRSQPGQPAPSMPRYYTRALDVMNHEQHPLNSMLVRAIGTALKASGIPSYVYLAQVNDSWLATHPEFSRAVGVIERELAGFGGSFAARSIRFEPTSASRFVTDITSLPDDPVHIRKPGGFGPYLAGQLCALEAQVGNGVACTPLAAGGGSQ